MKKISEKTQLHWKSIPPIIYKVGLNSNLISSQELNQHEIGLVFSTHGEKCALFNKARIMLRKFADKDKIDGADILEISALNKELEILEFRSQRAWKFDESEAHHNWWLDLPGCRCPQMDNRERFGISGNINVGNCPWHGWFDQTDSEI